MGPLLFGMQEAAEKIRRPHRLGKAQETKKKKGKKKKKERIV